MLDGSVGQNALSQGKEFDSSVQLSGLVVTKLDGTPKGGVVVALANELSLPVRYIGLGEKISDLKPFSPGEFSEAIFDGSDLDLSEVSLSDTAVDVARPRRRKRR